MGLSIDLEEREIQNNLSNHSAHTLKLLLTLQPLSLIRTDRNDRPNAVSCSDSALGLLLWASRQDAEQLTALRLR